MTVKEKSALIGSIISQLRLEASTRKKPFDTGDTFLALAFKSDDELLKIAKLCGI
jgi:hypothetical protein